MAKRKTTKRKTKKGNSSKFLTYIAWTLAIIAMILSSILIGYYLGYGDAEKEVTQESKVQKEKRLALLKKLEDSVKEEKDVKKRLQAVLKKETPQLTKEIKKKSIYTSAAHEFDGAPLSKEPKILQRKKRVVGKKPRLAIIIDDVSTASQVKAIKSLHLPLTMSFLPPSKGRPNTPRLASHENFYMVHLPMEALHWNAEEPFTLHVHDSQAYISQRIKKIKELFPKTKYINNHTGSKFTSDETSMNRLITALNANHIHFIDSRTTAATKAPKVLKNFGLKYVARDVFLDHHMDKPYVLKQIKQAIKVAKAHGTAIAIGHPHKNTLKALYESKSLFKDVELVFVNKL